MKFTKKKKLHEGEFIVYSPNIHWIKIISPLLVSFVILIYLFTELLSCFSSRLPLFVSLSFLVCITVYFLLQVMESVNRGYFVKNKLLITIITLCPMLLLIRLFYADIWFLSFSQKIIGNMKFVLLTLFILSGVHANMQIAEYVSEEYYITNRRLIIKKGFFTDTITDIPIEKLEGLSFSQGFWGNLFKYGTIRILGLGGSRPCIITVKKPYAVRQQINTVIDKNKAITVVQKDYPESIVKTITCKPGLPEYGPIATLFAPEKKEKA